MNTQHTGLTSEEVIKNREKYGTNILTPPKKDSLLKRFMEKLTGPFGHVIPGWEDGEPLIFILEIAAFLSIFISCAEYYGWMGLTGNSDMGMFLEPMGILIAIILATGIAFIFELKADREFNLLNLVNDQQQVKVIRDGHPTTIPRKDVVVGDIVLLETGEEIPADIQLLDASSLLVDESSLTGEPVCRKSVNKADLDKEATFPTDYVMRGTKVMEGHGIGRVFAVGDKTENGKVFQATQVDDSVKTPLNEQLDRLGAMIAKVSYVLALLIFIGRTFSLLHGVNYDWSTLPKADTFAYLLQSFMLAVTLIVVAVPEGLPMAVTLSLAYSMRRMLQTNNLVRKMHACETMGAATVICTDKTGTLTQNKMQVRHARFLFPKNTPQEIREKKIEECIALNSTAELDFSKGQPEVLGNPTEGALLLWLHDHKKDYRATRNAITKVAEIPFSTENKYMATLVNATRTGLHRLYVKGAPEIILNMCNDIPDDIPSGQLPKEKMTIEAKRQRILEEITAYQNKGMRTLAFAETFGREEKEMICGGKIHTSELTFLGFVAISDPVREDVPEAVQECLDAGINVKIVTGDTTATACEIARQVGLLKENEKNDKTKVTTGPEIARMSNQQLQEQAQQIKIVARARPMDKKRLVEALQAKGEVVAVTGDGTNDAPALKTAHVGLSMGDGTAVAKEASDITIIDNSFSSIGQAVMWGRSLYQNIQRFILFQMTVNVVACLIVLVGAFLGTESPLTVTQMLWVNLIMDTFAAMALASLPPSQRVMAQKPRNRKDFIINRSMWCNILGVGGLFFAILLTLLFAFRYADVRSLCDLFHLEKGGGGTLSSYELSLFFTIFVMLQFWNLFNAKGYAAGSSTFILSGCKGFVLIASVIILGQVLIINLGGQFFNVVPISLMDWGVIIGSTFLVALLGEVFRFIKFIMTDPL